MEAMLWIPRRHLRALAVVRYFCGMESAREESLVVSITQRLSPHEQTSLVAAYAAAEDGALSLGPTLAGKSTHLQRRPEWPLALKRAQARQFLEWCSTPGVDPRHERLPYTFLAR